MTLDALEDRTLLSTSIPLNTATWTAMGPAPITGTSNAGGTGQSTGRLTGIAGDPTNANILYLTAAGGGVWKSTNAGVSWTPLTDNQATLFMGSIAVAKSNPQIIYAGTGEANNSGDSFAGAGVLKSTNGGTTWALVGNSALNGLSIARIVINPTNPNVVYAATTNLGGDPAVTTNRTGIYKSTDGGATWTNTTASLPQGSLKYDEWTDVAMDPTAPNTLYAADGLYVGDTTNGVYKTTDGGNTWSRAGNFLLGAANGTTFGHIALAISPTSPSTIIASIADPATSGLKAVEKTTDGGTTWAALAGVPNYLGGQGWYDNTIAIDPNNAQIFYAAGVVTYGSPDKFGVVESRDGGATWFDLTRDQSGTEPHTDTHALAFDANGKLLIGNDGGIWRLQTNVSSTNFSWSNINSNLQVTQFTGVALNPTNADLMYGGSQDNGTEKFNDNLIWTQVRGGDGGYVKVDPTTPSTIYTEYYGISLARSTDSGATWTDITSGINFGDSSNFYVYYTIDPSNSSHLLYGTNRIYTTTNQGTSWTALTSPNSAGWNSSSPINWITIAPTDPNTIYATTSDGHIWVTTDGGTSWNQRDVTGASDTFQQIVVDPRNAQTAYIVRNAYNNATNTGHIFMTTNGGQTWSDISGTLPDVPCYSFAIDTRAVVNRMYVGTNTGVYATTIGTTSWTKFKSGMPNAQVVSLEVQPSIDVLMAGTHGRGVFEISSTDQLSVLGISPSAGTEGTAFTNVLLARFVDSPSNGVLSNYSATIDWGDTYNPTITTGTIVNLGGGFYGVEGSHTYSEAGTYNATIIVTSKAGHTGSGGAAITVKDAALTPTGATLSTVVGATLSGTVGSFADANTSAPLSDFTATINWGDGVQTAGTVVSTATAGVFNVQGTHAYKAVKNYTISIVVKDTDGATTTITSTATVADAPLTAIPVTFQAMEGIAFSNVTVGSFTSANQFAVATDYSSVTVSWGDGTADSTLTSGVTLQAAGGQFNVLAGHTYVQMGTYPVTIVVVSAKGSTVTINSTANVVDAPINASVSSQSTNEGGTVVGVVGSINDTNPNGVAVDLTPGSTINWGDGTTETILVALDPAHPAEPYLISQGNGKFNVYGTHQYGEEGSYTVTINGVSVGGSTSSATGVTTVNDAPIQALTATVYGVAGQPVATKPTDAIASFTDAYLGAPLTDYSQNGSISINWGDGSISSGYVLQPGGTGSVFYVAAGSLANPGHLYPRAGTYAVTVTVTDKGGSTSSVASKAIISDSPITNAYVATIPALTQGQSYSGTVATFSNGNSLSVASDFITTIDWGDHTSTQGQVVVLGGGNYLVQSLSPHFYDQVGVYPINVQIISLGGSRATASTTAAAPTTQAVITVNEAPFVDVTTPAMAITGTAGVSYSGIVAAFTEYANAPITDFLATINWGDGTTPTTGVVASSASGDGSFTVSGTHTYANFGSYNGSNSITVTVEDVDDTPEINPPGHLVNTATISDVPLTGRGLSISGVAGFDYKGNVATFNSPNLLAQFGEFQAVIDWGDGTTPSTGTVSGSNGNFTVSGEHVYAKPAAADITSITITHTSYFSANPGSTLVVNGSTHVLVPVSGAMSRASDSGVSNTDGITNITRPVFTGSGEPGAIVHIVAATAGSGVGSGTDVGKVTIDSTGNWSIQISPLGDGSYTCYAQMYDPGNGALAQTSTLQITPGGGTTLVVDTAGPTVSSVVFTPSTGQLVVTLKDGLSGLNPAGLGLSSNFQLAAPNGNALTPYAVRSLVVGGGGNQATVTVSYNLGAKVRTGVYVVTLNALGLTDLAGNTLVEKTLIAFPQTTNSPNPNYIAEFDVARNLTTSAPKQYISIPEQIAAGTYSNYVQKHKVVRVPPRPTAMPKVTLKVKAKTKG